MVGQAGLYQAAAMFLVAYFIITMTVLSICAISTNGALDAGGAYCILSTPVVWITSGPEPDLRAPPGSSGFLRVLATWVWVCLLSPGLQT